MTENEVQIINDLFKFIETLHYKVKVHDEVIERILINKPDLLPSTLMAKIEESNRKIAIVDLAELKDKIQNL